MLGVAAAAAQTLILPLWELRELLGKGPKGVTALAQHRNIVAAAAGVQAA
jgi:hypothetical protein